MPMRSFPPQGVATPKQVADLQIDVGDASAGALGSLYAIFGNWTVTLLAAIGYEGATALASKLTAARAALLDQITALRMAELDAANIPADVDTLLARLTALRAGYLDNINQAGLLQLTAARAGYLDTLEASRVRMLCSVDYWSVPQLSVVVPGGAANQALPDVVVAALPAGVTVVKATSIFKFRSLTNAGAANKLTNGQHIQIQKGGAGGYADAISLIDDQFTVAAAAVDAPGDVIVGDHNVVAKVTGNDTYNFQWTSAVADVAGLTFNDVQMGLRIWYSV